MGLDSGRFRRRENFHEELESRTNYGGVSMAVFFLVSDIRVTLIFRVGRMEIKGPYEMITYSEQRVGVELAIVGCSGAPFEICRSADVLDVKISLVCKTTFAMVLRSTLLTIVR